MPARSSSTQASGEAAAAGAPRDPRRTVTLDPAADKLMAGIFADPVAAGQLLFTPGLLWAAAVKDASAMGVEPAVYLAGVRAKIVPFLEDACEDGIPRVVDHETTLTVLRLLGVSDSNGLMQLLTGPRSIGKSLLLRKVAAEINKDTKHPRRVVLFDARQYGTDLTRGIITYLTADHTLLKFALDVAPSPVAAALTLAAKFAAPLLKDEGDVLASGATGFVEGVAKYSRDRLNAAVPLDELIGTFFAACKKAGKRPIIIIDEANKALAARDEGARARTLDLLDLLTRVTKQHHEATVLLATSEHGLPFRLRALGYNKHHIGKTIVAEEVPPAVMMGLLMGDWGCGEHLATALLMMYGGHVLHASAAVRELGIAADALQASVAAAHEPLAALDPAAMDGAAAISAIISAPAECLSDSMLDAANVPADWQPSAAREVLVSALRAVGVSVHSERAKMRMRVLAALRALVVDGFVPLDNEADKAAEVISHANAGCVVPRGATAASVPPHAWDARTASGEAPRAILLPASHIMRLLLASKVFPPPSKGAGSAPLA